MKKFITGLTVLVAAMFLVACSDSDSGETQVSTQTVVAEKVIPTLADTDNYIAYIGVDIIDVTTSCVTVNVQGGDDDGVNRVDTYIIDAYKLQNNIANYVVEKVSTNFDSNKDTAFDFDVMFEGLHDNKLYIVRTVAYTVNGMTVTEEKVSMNNYVRTDANPTPATEPAPEPDPDPTPDTEAPVLTITEHTVRDSGTLGIEVVDHSDHVSDNVTPDADLRIEVTTPNAEVAVTNTGASVRFERIAGGAGDEVIGFVFVDEAGNKSAELVQTILLFDTI